MAHGLEDVYCLVGQSPDLGRAERQVDRYVRAAVVDEVVHPHERRPGEHDPLVGPGD